MAKGDTTITFRGEANFFVDYDIDESGTVEWCFHGLNAEQHDALKITPEEYDAIAQACIAAHGPRGSDEPPDPPGWEGGFAANH